MNSCYLLIVSRFGLKQKQMNVNCKQNLTKKKMYKQQTKSEQLFTKQTKKNLDNVIFEIKCSETNKQKQTRSINLLIAIHRDRLQSREIDKAENTSDDRQTHTQKERVTKYELEN